MFCYLLGLKKWSTPGVALDFSDLKELEAFQQRTAQAVTAEGALTQLRLGSTPLAELRRIRN